jgi:hypothetical protein
MVFGSNIYLTAIDGSAIENCLCLKNMHRTTYVYISKSNLNVFEKLIAVDNSMKCKPSALMTSQSTYEYTAYRDLTIIKIVFLCFFSSLR